MVALTHMRWPNDLRLAENAPEIDLILGGHDHEYTVKKVNSSCEQRLLADKEISPEKKER